MLIPSRLILASASPRRRELISLLGLPYEVLPSRYEEPTSHDREIRIADFVQFLALEKAREVATRCGGGWVIGADTEVSLEEIGNPLGKPTDDADAFRMLRTLSGRTHRVTTGVAIIPVSEAGVMSEPMTFAEVTEVTFRSLTDTMIRRYVETGDPLDKAGAYGAQDSAALFIEQYDGDFFNVVGLPVCALAKRLEESIKW
ncbi:MAG: septum formation protein Maf [Chthonomonadaceae bacterium]|nr:septum formation protein Maf [Chthonomonadaceae bacterium]